MRESRMGDDNGKDSNRDGEAVQTNGKRGTRYSVHEQCHGLKPGKNDATRDTMELVESSQSRVWEQEEAGRGYRLVKSRVAGEAARPMWLGSMRSKRNLAAMTVRTPQRTGGEGEMPLTLTWWIVAYSELFEKVVNIGDDGCGIVGPVARCPRNGVAPCR